MTTRHNLRIRIARLEGGNTPKLVKEAERDFWRAVKRAMRQLGTADAFLSATERFDRLTPVEHIGWALRFAEQSEPANVLRFADQPDLAAILRGYGLGPPSTLISWALLTAWIPGDNEI